MREVLTEKLHGSTKGSWERVEQRVANRYGKDHAREANLRIFPTTNPHPRHQVRICRRKIEHGAGGVSERPESKQMYCYPEPVVCFRRFHPICAHAGQCADLC